MSVISTVARSGPFLITALPQIINTGFPFETGSDLIVYNSGPVGLPYDPAIVLTLGSDYTISGGGYNGANQLQPGSINVVSTGVNSVAINDRLVIARNIPINQPDSFQTTGTLTIVQLEQSLDRQATISQEINEGVTRSLRFEPDEFLDGTLFRDLRKGNVLGFDSNGNLTYYAFVGGVVLPQSVQGTLNQVLVNGSVGIPTTGAVVLTLPQSIGITNIVQFGKAGLGIAPSPNNTLTINHVPAPMGAAACVEVVGVLNAPALTDLHPNGFRDTTIYTSAVANDAYASFDAQANLSGALAYNHFYGFQARGNYIGSGSVNVMSGYNSSLTVTSGTINELRGYYVPDAIQVGGTITHYSGLYIDQLTRGVTRHAIYIAGNDNVLMAGGQLAISDLIAPINASGRVSVIFDQGSQFGIDVQNKNVTSTGYFIQFWNSLGAQQGSVQQTNSTTVAFNTSSDLRLKENIRPMSDCGAILDALNPCIFDWRWGGKNFHGFVAQELHEAFPEAVSVGDDDDKILKPWAVDFSKLVPVLAAELKNLRSRVSQLESQ